MRHAWGIGVFLVVIFCVAGLCLAQVSQGGARGKVDQPVTKAGESSEVEEEEEEDDLPDPPPYFGEDGGVGEKMKIVWCVDRSGSMAWDGGSFTGVDGEPVTGSRWDRALAETIIALSQLTPEWMFGIVTFACNRDQFSPDLVEAEAGNVQSAIGWMSGKRPYGGTGTGPAQAQAFRLADGGEEGTATCWLLSDGQPNCGATGTAGHKAMALAANTGGHVLNTVGIADSGIFAQFMREMAEATGGSYVHVQ
jgi:hypothetical protein